MGGKGILIVVAAGVCSFGASVSAAREPGRCAVVIGINDYADSAIPDLRYAESDARAVYETLTDPNVGRFAKDNVKLLLGKQASASNIKAALYGLRGTGKEQLVVIFYSGHGAKEGEEAFWVTQAAKRKALPATALPNSDIRKFLAKIPSRRLVVFLDCCYAASTVKKSLEEPAKLFGELGGKGRVTIAGSADNQEALEYEDKKSGVFSYFLVRGLRGEADRNTDGVVTFEEIWHYLGENVRNASVKQGGLHEPVIISERGLTPQFLLTFNPKAQAASKQAVVLLRKLFADDKITGAQFDMGRKALSEPALDAVAKARREVFAELVAGRLSPKLLEDVLQVRIKKAGGLIKPPTLPPATKPTLAVVPFDVLGEVTVKDAGRILAEQLLPSFAEKYQIIDLGQLKRFLEQDDLEVSDVMEVASPSSSTKSVTKAVKLKRVRYLVVGTLCGLPGGSLSVTARICDWQSGTVRQNRFAQIGGENWRDLLGRLPRLAAKLTGAAPGAQGSEDLVLSPSTNLRRLEQAIKLWADEATTTGPNETQFRQAVEKLSEMAWHKALLAGINTGGLLAKGSALEVLARRVPEVRLRQSILAIRPRTEAVLVLRLLIQKFDHLPKTGSALLRAVVWTLKSPDDIDGAAQLCRKWRDNYSYRFNVRDIHVLSRLQGDRLRKKVSRTQLIVELARRFIKRRHVSRKVSRPTGACDSSDRLTKHLHTLTMADLWNLLLLDEMLNRPRTQAALRVMANSDRVDKRSAWGGLVFYEGGRAEAKLYPPDYGEGASDLLFKFTDLATRASRDCLCFFHGHFEKLDNRQRAGPTADELKEARQRNLSGLVVTSVSKDAFCAHYYSPEGIVVSMGILPFR